MKQQCFLLLAPALLAAQPDTRPIGRVTYTQLANTSAEADRNGPATLLFNNSRSLYAHDSAPKRDSSYSSADFVSASTFGDYEGFPILKLHGEGKLFSRGGDVRLQNREHRAELGKLTRGLSLRPLSGPENRPERHRRTAQRDGEGRMHEPQQVILRMR